MQRDRPLDVLDLGVGALDGDGYVNTSGLGFCWSLRRPPRSPVYPPDPGSISSSCRSSSWSSWEPSLPPSQRSPGLVVGLDRIPGHLLRSVTFDQGSEWANWPVIAGHYGIDVWFCDPHSPWQRGQVENLNRQWRWWFPRGTELRGLDPDHVDDVAAIINGQRRRLLNGDSPASLYAAATVHRPLELAADLHADDGKEIWFAIDR